VRLTVAVFLLLFLLPALAWADQFDDVQAAQYREDWQTALKLLQPLADQGNARAQHEIGSMYADGRGVKQNIGTAIKWWHRAADQGNKFALFTLDHLDYKAVLKPLEPLADQGDPDAQCALGEMYEKGLGVKQDYAEAYFWLSLAPKLPHRADVFFDTDTAGKVAEHLTHEQKSALDKRVEEWVKAHQDLVDPLAQWRAKGPPQPKFINDDDSGIGDRAVEEWVKAHPAP
jgi:TPR repeat protein